MSGSEDQFQVVLDVTGFSQDEITVQTDDRYILYEHFK